MGFFDAVGDALAGAASTVAGVAGDAYNGACAVGNTVSNAVHSAEEGITNGVHTAEDWVNKESHALAGQVADIPVVGALANGAADYVSMNAEVLGGVVGGATTLVGGVANAVAHPIDTVNGLN